VSARKEGDNAFSSISTIGVMLSGLEIDNMVCSVCVRVNVCAIWLYEPWLYTACRFARGVFMCLCLLHVQVVRLCRFPDDMMALNHATPWQTNRLLEDQVSSSSCFGILLLILLLLCC